MCYVNVALTKNNFDLTNLKKGGNIIKKGYCEWGGFYVEWASQITLKSKYCVWLYRLNNVPWM